MVNDAPVRRDIACAAAVQSASPQAVNPCLPCRLPPRRSFVLIAVLVIVGSALLVATQVLFLAQAESAGAAGAADAAQSRALLWSGAQVVMSKLNDQRDAILSGEWPQLDQQYIIYETPSRQGIVRLIASHPAGRLCACESGKLDLNSIDAEALARTGMLDQTTAAAIVAYRTQLGRPFQSVLELLHVPDADITPEMLIGPVDDISIMDDAQHATEDLAQRVAERLQGHSLRGLADLLTVFSVEPDLQSTGRLRINLNQPWSDDLGRQIEDRFGAEAAARIKGMFDRGVKFDSPAKFIQLLRQAQLPIEDWPEIIDAFTTQSGEYRFGRLDINTAPYEALLALPGITPEQAAQIVSVRQELSSHERATIAWPVIAQILPPEALEQLADRITTRCWTYCVLIAGGETWAETPDGPLDRPMIWELVIDLSAPQPRLAYVRDVTMLQNAAMIASSVSSMSSITSPIADRQDRQADVDAESAEAGEDDPALNESDTDTSDEDDDAPDQRDPDPSSDDEPSVREHDAAEENAPAAPAAPASPVPSSSRKHVGRWNPGR